MGECPLVSLGALLKESDRVWSNYGKLAHRRMGELLETFSNFFVWDLCIWYVSPNGPFRWFFAEQRIDLPQKYVEVSTWMKASAVERSPWPLKQFACFRITSFFLYSGFFFFLRFYLFIHERHREKEAERHRAEGEAGSMRGAQCGTDPLAPRQTPNHWATQVSLYSGFWQFYKLAFELLCGQRQKWNMAVSIHHTVQKMT